MLDDGWKSKISADLSRPRHRTFAPSSFRCKRKSWFRLRGAEPKCANKPDTRLDFTAEVGTACHRLIQNILSTTLEENWVNVADYLDSNPLPYAYELSSSEDSLETKISILNPPVTFACDGLIKVDGKVYLLEIKTSDFGSFDDLTDVKPGHVDQIRCYSALLKIPNVLVLYVDRQYGGTKCYERKFTQLEMEQVVSEMKDIQHLADINIPPEKLPSNDYWCQSCEYRKQCKEWG